MYSAHYIHVYIPSICSSEPKHHYHTIVLCAIATLLTCFAFTTPFVSRAAFVRIMHRVQLFGLFRNTTRVFIRMVTCFLRVLASPGVLLLLTTTTTPIIERADGAGSSSDDLTVACRVEITACRDDEACTSCFTIPDASRAVFHGCSESTIAHAADSSTVYCLNHMAEMCCLNDASEKGCLDNDPFVNYWMCAMDVGGCWVDTIACDDGRVVESSRSGVAAGLQGAPVASTSPADIV